MTDAEWNALRMALGVGWPHAPKLEYEILREWRRILDELPGPRVLEAVAGLMRSGREFPPPVGVIYHRAMEIGERPPELMPFEEMNAASLAAQERISGTGPEPLRVIVGAERLRLRAAEEPS
jgi:hypothetical protein